jgi:hypothetical protein
MSKLHGKASRLTLRRCDGSQKQTGTARLVGKASRLTVEFGYFQDFIRINKSLISTKAERDLGLWLKGAGENTSRRDGAIVAWHEVPGTAPPKRAVP